MEGAKDFFDSAKKRLEALTEKTRTLSSVSKNQSPMSSQSTPGFGNISLSTPKFQMSENERKYVESLEKGMTPEQAKLAALAGITSDLPDIQDTIVRDVDDAQQVLNFDEPSTSETLGKKFVSNLASDFLSAGSSAMSGSINVMEASPFKLIKAGAYKDDVDELERLFNSMYDSAQGSLFRLKSLGITGHDTYMTEEGVERTSELSLPGTRTTFNLLVNYMKVFRGDILNKIMATVREMDEYLVHFEKNKEGQTDNGLMFHNMIRWAGSVQEFGILAYENQASYDVAMDISRQITQVIESIKECSVETKHLAAKYHEAKRGFKEEAVLDNLIIAKGIIIDFMVHLQGYYTNPHASKQSAELGDVVSVLREITKSLTDDLKANQDSAVHLMKHSNIMTKTATAIESNLGYGMAQGAISATPVVVPHHFDHSIEDVYAVMKPNIDPSLSKEEVWAFSCSVWEKGLAHTMIHYIPVNEIFNFLVALGVHSDKAKAKFGTH